jgi:hypothetical protein
MASFDVDARMAALMQRQLLLLEHVAALEATAERMLSGTVSHGAEPLTLADAAPASPMQQLLSAELHEKGITQEKRRFVRAPPEYYDRSVRRCPCSGSGCVHVSIWGSVSTTFSCLPCLTTHPTTHNTVCRPLEFRRKVLHAASIDHLCKTICMENTRIDAPLTEDLADPGNGKYYLCVVQYTAKFDSDKMKVVVHGLCKGQLSKK